MIGAPNDAVPAKALEVSGLTVSANGRRLVGPLTFALDHGTTLGLRGPSGACVILRIACVIP